MSTNGMNSSDLLTFRHYYRHILKNLAVLFATVLISASLKIGVDMNRQVANSKFNYSRRKAVRHCFFDLSSSACARGSEERKVVQTVLVT